MFSLVPISNQSKSLEGVSSSDEFLLYVENDEFSRGLGPKILCFFDRAMSIVSMSARSLDSLSEFKWEFSSVHIVFSDTEEGKIPEFFDVQEKNTHIKLWHLVNYETDEVDSYMEITFPYYDNPVIILYDGNRQIKLYSGTSENEFSAEDLNRILYE